jgi:transposase
VRGDKSSSDKYQAFLMHQHGKSFEEIAKEFGIKPQKARQWVNAEQKQVEREARQGRQNMRKPKGRHRR